MALPAVPLALRRARALTLVRAIGFDGACLRGKCEADPALGYDLMSRFAQVADRAAPGDAAPAPRRLWLRRQLTEPLERPGRWRRVPYRVARRAARDARHVDARARAGRGRAARVRAGPVHDALRLRRRRGADLGLAAAADGPLVHTVRAVGAVTRGDLRARGRATVLGVRGPFGNALAGRARPPARDVVVVAGGIGLAPLRPAVYHAAAHRARVRRGGAALRRAHARPTCSIRDELERWRGAVRPRGRRHRRQRRAAAGAGKVGVVPKLIAGARLRPGADGRVRLRAGDHDALRRSRRSLERGVAAGAHLPLDGAQHECGIGHCGHCQLGPTLICRDGPVYRYDELAPLLAVREL